MRQKFFTYQEASDYTNLPLNTVKIRLRNPSIPYRRFMHRKIFDLEYVERINYPVEYNRSPSKIPLLTRKKIIDYWRTADDNSIKSVSENLGITWHWADSAIGSWLKGERFELLESKMNVE